MSKPSITTFVASDFASREDLENKIRASTQLDVSDKPDMQITGTREQLERLGLSDRSIFWGIKCVITDTPTPIVKQSEREKPQRGDVHKFGINGQLK